MQENQKTRICPVNRHPTYTLQRYYLITRQAEMKCTACDYSYLRPMNDSESFALRKEVKFLVDASTLSFQDISLQEERR